MLETTSGGRCDANSERDDGVDLCALGRDSLSRFGPFLAISVSFNSEAKRVRPKAVLAPGRRASARLLLPRTYIVVHIIMYLYLQYLYSSKL